MKAILGGSGVGPSKSTKKSSQADPMTDIIGAILGGAQGQASGAGSQSGGGLEDILGSILGGQTQQSPTGQQPAGGLEDILGSILGGQTQQSQTRNAQPTGGLAEILGSILGGGRVQQTQQQSGGSITDFLGEITGQSPMQSNSFLGPIVTKLAKQLGLPPVVAQMIVSFAISKLMPSAAAASGAMGSTARPTGQAQRPAQRIAPQAQEGLNLDSLLDTIGTGDSTSASYITQSGMSRELAEQMGMDEGMATDSLQQVYKMLQGALGSSQQGQQSGRQASTSPTAKRTSKRVNRGTY